MGNPNPLCILWLRGVAMHSGFLRSSLKLGFRKPCKCCGLPPRFSHELFGSTVTPQIFRLASKLPLDELGGGD